MNLYSNKLVSIKSTINDNEILKLIEKVRYYGAHREEIKNIDKNDYKNIYKETSSKVNVVVCSVLKVQVPTLSSALILIVSLYLLSTFLFVLAHEIALFFKKFGSTYAITMTLYFAIMILGGMFGVQAKDFLDSIKAVAYTLPTTYIGGEFIEFCQSLNPFQLKFYILV